MSHHIYQTECLILRSQNFGESNKLFFLLTKDLGFIVAMAQGVRELKSKLRYSMQDFSRSRIDLVRGKEMWRITNADSIKNYSKVLNNENKKIIKARVYSFLRRLLHGEEKNERLFAAVLDFVEFLDSNELNNNELFLVEIAINLKILNLLGYGSIDKNIAKLSENNLSSGLLREIAKNRQDALAAINLGIKESQL